MSFPFNVTLIKARNGAKKIKHHAAFLYFFEFYRSIVTEYVEIMQA